MSQGYKSFACPEWAPKSPDLNPLDFWLWSYLKGELTKGGWPNHLDEMKQRLLEIASLIPQEMINRSVDCFDARVRICFERSGGIIDHLV